MSIKPLRLVAALAVIAAHGSPAAGAEPTPTTGQPAAGGTPASPHSAPTLRKLSDPEAAGGGIEAVEDPGRGVGDHDVALAGKLRRPDRALVGVELSPGVAIPLKRYLDFGSGQNTYYMENGVGVGIAVSLTLDNVEMRYSYAALSAGRVRARIPDSTIDWLRLIDRQLGGDGQLPQELDIEAEQALKLHTITFGYRLTFEPTRQLRVVVPLGIGIAVTQPPAFGLLSYSLYGFGSYVGLRGEWLIADLVAIGLDTRLSLLVTEPDPNLGAASYAATSNVFDAAIAWLPLIDVALAVRVYY